MATLLSTGTGSDGFCFIQGHLFFQKATYGPWCQSFVSWNATAFLFHPHALEGGVPELWLLPAGAGAEPSLAAIGPLASRVKKGMLLPCEDSFTRFFLVLLGFVEKGSDPFYWFCIIFGEQPKSHRCYRLPFFLRGARVVVVSCGWDVGGINFRPY